MELSAVFKSAEDGGIIAVNPETGTSAYGTNMMEALMNLREATERYLEVFPPEDDAVADSVTAEEGGGEAAAEG